MENFIKGRTLDNGSQDTQILEQLLLSGLSESELGVHDLQKNDQQISHLLYLPLFVPRAPPARALK